MKFKDKTVKWGIDPVEFDKLTVKKKNKIFDKIFRGRKVAHFDFRMSNGRPLCKTWYEKLPRGSIFRRNGKLKVGVYESLLIKPTKTARLISVVPFRLGYRPQSFNYPDHRFFEHLRMDRHFGKQFDVFEDDRIEISGSWPTQYLDFQKMCEPVKHKVNYFDYILGIVSRGDKIKLPYIERDPKECDVDAVVTNGRANCGLVSQRLFGQDHFHADEKIRPIAKRLYSFTKNNITCDRSL